ncbi:MAG: Carbon monoxide dehydrogenase medium chain [Alphaproteobacteria bacterium MarineAlpha9_Bin4]|nr:carbon monoxide dehydrogenase [Pelagibacterales bacterium]PPR26121.1 MAG: Carbon monoxide dehydrogenase medium chain [Alphaproteobacteria bacterium MarineAlpha9_Bin4]|tara:strand:- start:2591 stop:3391 length:801 start_codon:yes stop_codon:yes gene_type:complete
MKKFNYHTPKNLNEGYELFKSCDFPQYLAGGMTILPSIKQGLASPSDLIDLSYINEMHGITEHTNSITLGGLTTHNEVAQSNIIINKVPGLASLASEIADNAVRNKGTLGGSICNADPAADYPAALIALNAKLTTNLREIHVKDFFLDMFETSLYEGEILKNITLSKVDYSCYKKFSSQASKYAIVGVFTSVNKKKVKVSITGASNKVFLLDELDNLYLDKAKEFNLDKINFNKYDINNDINASADYRVSLIKSLIKNSLKNLTHE